MMDWSDIPFVLAVCEAGSLSGAARSLGVNHSTVFRRIENIESKLGVRLFERLSHGYIMTPAGERFYQNGQALRDGMDSLQRELSGQDLRLEGVLTVTTTDSLLYWLTPMFVDFQAQYPDVELRILSESRPLDLMQRDADVALRPTKEPPEHWVGRKLVPINFSPYAKKDYWQGIKELPAEQHRWIRLHDDLNQSPMSQITHVQKAESAPITIANTMMGVFDLVRLGLGIGALPCYLGDNCPELIRLSEPEPKYEWNLWVLAHPDVRRNARVHAFFEFASAQITEKFVYRPN